MDDPIEHILRKHGGLPAAVDIERLVLGALLTDEQARRFVEPAMDCSDFSLMKHQRIYSAIRAIWNHGDRVDRVIVARELQAHGHLENVGGISYLVSLDDSLPRIHNLEGYVQIVREKAILRRAIISAYDFARRCAEAQATPDLIEEAAVFWRNMSGQVRTEVELQSLGEYIDTHGGLQEFFSPKRLQPVVPLPWENLAEIVGGGLRRSELIIIAGRPAHGKSAAAGQIAHHAAQAGKAAILFSLEMDADQIWYRLIAAAARVPLQRWRKQRVNEFERIEFQRVAADISEMPLWISDKPNAVVGAMRSAITRHKAAGKPLDLILIDYLQLMASAKRSDSRAQEVSEICRDLKLWAKELRIPIIALAQVRRYKDEDRCSPTLDTLKESGAIEESADIVVFIWAAAKDRQTAIEKRKACRILIHVAKQRNGPIGRFDAWFSSRYVRLDENLESDRDDSEV